MGMTIAEKIIAAAAGVNEVKPGDIHTVELDRLMSNDGTTHLTIDMYNKLKNPHIADVNKLVWIVDHNVPCDSVKTAASHKKMRDFAKEHGIKFYEGAGVCHQVMMENHVTQVNLFLVLTVIPVLMVLLVHLVPVLDVRIISMPWLQVSHGFLFLKHLDLILKENLRTVFMQEILSLLL